MKSVGPSNQTGVHVFLHSKTTNSSTFFLPPTPPQPPAGSKTPRWWRLPPRTAALPPLSSLSSAELAAAAAERSSGGGEREGGMGAGKRAAVEELIERAGGCAVIDGGFATQLEREGADIADPLWSAVCLISNPDLIRKVHLQYLEAGADILVTSSYQATIPGFLSRGLSVEEGELLLQKSVKLALEARDSFWKFVQRVPQHSYNHALVAASIGSYGAYLADGSEYSGCYGPDVSLEKLKDFHRRRLQVLVDAGPDMLAFETIPNKIEAQALVELLEEEKVQIPSWICFSSVDGEHLASGESFAECLDILNKSKNVTVVGINCSPPQFMENLICKFRKLTGKPIAVYPNSGEIWDGRAKRWLPSECFGDEKFEALAKRWHECGASLIGGCCRTTPSTIQGISKALKDRS